MKKILMLITGLVTVITMSFCFTACGSSSATIDDIAGVWVATSYSADGKEETDLAEQMSNQRFISIEEDGSALFATYGYKFDGTITDNGDSTFTFKHDAFSLKDITFVYEDERLYLDRSEEKGAEYIEYYSTSTMDALKASLNEPGDDSDDSDSGDLSDTMSNIQCQIISLDIPILWTGKYDFDSKINEDKSGYVTLYQKSSRAANGGGDLVTIMIEEPSNDYTEYPDYEYLGTLKQNGFDYNVIALYPTDVQFTPENQAEYEEMQKDLPKIVNSVEGINGAIFTKK